MKFTGIALLSVLVALSADPAIALESGSKPAGTLIDFRVDIRRNVANDLGHALAYAEMNGADPSDVARKVKAAIAEGLAIAKGFPGITVKSGNTQTFPIYGKNGRTIESWRMRSEILIESRDAAALSVAVGKLQGVLAIGSLRFSPAPETRRQAEDDAALEAVDAFRAKAERIATTLKKNYRIRRMNLTGHTPPPFGRPIPMMRASAMAEDSAAPMPVESGDSEITASVSGQIELVEDGKQDVLLKP